MTRQHVSVDVDEHARASSPGSQEMIMAFRKRSALEFAPVEVAPLLSPALDLDEHLRDLPDPDPLVEQAVARMRSELRELTAVDAFGRPVPWRYVARVVLGPLTGQLREQALAKLRYEDDIEDLDEVPAGDDLPVVHPALHMVPELETVPAVESWSEPAEPASLAPPTLPEVVAEPLQSDSEPAAVVEPVDAEPEPTVVAPRPTSAETEAWRALFVVAGASDRLLSAPSTAAIPASDPHR